MAVSNIGLLLEMDRGTINENDRQVLEKSLAEQGVAYIPYAKRVGPALSAVASEIKRDLDRTIAPLLEKALPKITGGRFEKLYSDVRIYPEGQELAVWNDDDWSGTVLNVVVSFVLAVPADDKLDSFARLSVVSLFEDEPKESVAEKVKDVSAFRAALNVNTVSSIMGEIRMHHFYPEIFGGMSLEINIDACREKDFSAMSREAQGIHIKAERQGDLEPTDPSLPITADNAEVEVPRLIAALARELGVERIDPEKLEPSDSLLALMGFDHSLAFSLAKSITMQFDVVDVIGGERMVSVGNAIDFAKMFGSDGDIE